MHVVPPRRFFDYLSGCSRGEACKCAHVALQRKPVRLVPAKHGAETGQSVPSPPGPHSPVYESIIAVEEGPGGIEEDAHQRGIKARRTIRRPKARWRLLVGQHHTSAPVVTESSQAPGTCPTDTAVGPEAEPMEDYSQVAAISIQGRVRQEGSEARSEPSLKSFSFPVPSLTPHTHVNSD